MKRLEGKIALVTGGTRGIGAAIVRAFLTEGATVAFSGTSSGSIARAAASFGADGPHHGFLADLSRDGAASDLVDVVIEHFGRIDVLVNNAGIVSRLSEWELTPEEWDRVHDVNLRAVFFAARDAALSMRRNGGGAIINMSSIAGQHGGIAGSPAYASSKAAVIGLTRSLARRFAPHGIRVNCLAPADIETDATANWPQELRDKLNAMTPLGRFGDVEEVSGAAVFLASREASFVTGQTLAINGGAYMQ
ncbi:3-oxoacyl-ACP reductase family protein [Bradyrhizobium sp. NP1]|uniref:SDR family NAD(P)-dependent oxidoreductase n=1 Tax=Bradyrhizobium sp. NP1 TaxID=3049772 RepID=UPI0025A56D31|nr:3-oxoacyl-ACP reductase family protein [Bradyrhizobium sp. NP1]WJR77293.1 3-oxoacyl-ACP reductase family protein [Bradyrhizobium sp. NP1]